LIDELQLARQVRAYNNNNNNNNYNYINNYTHTQHSNTIMSNFFKSFLSSVAGSASAEKAKEKVSAAAAAAAAATHPDDTSRKARSTGAAGSMSPPPPLPSRRPLKDLLRVRSLSKVLYQLPLVLPDLQEIQLDVVEWYCHVCLLETNTTRLTTLVAQLSQALGEHRPRTYGRLYNRLHMVALWNDICCLRLSLEEPEHHHHHHHAGHNHSHSHSHVQQLDISAVQWQQVREQLVLLKSYLLRQDANLTVPTLNQVPDPAKTTTTTTTAATATAHDAEDEYPSVPPSQAAPDGQLEKHDMFQQDYQQVLLLLSVHQVLAKFNESLHKIAVSQSEQNQQQQQQPQQQQQQQQQKQKLRSSSNISTTSSTTSTSTKDNLAAVNKLSEEAIDAYENSLLTVFEGYKQSNGNNKMTDGDDLVIPKELTAFLLRDLYQKGSNRHNQQAVDLVTSLQDHVRNMCLNPASEYSHASLKQKVRTE
jgi:hypothetical protein